MRMKKEEGTGTMFARKKEGGELSFAAF